MKFPIIFVWHGSPMNALEKNIYSESWKEIGKGIGSTPLAILMLSAHWITEWQTKINTTDKPEMIYDMYGFPSELYQVRYDCPGSKKISKYIIDTLSPEYFLLEDEKHGIDHGTWSTLIHMFPEASIPVIQMSLDYLKSPEWHYGLWKKLRTLREQGILIVWSGNFVHNLRAIDWSGKEKYDWATEFDRRAAHAIIEKNYSELLDFKSWGDISRLAHPTFDHFLPIFPLLGAVEENDEVQFFTPDITLGSLAMRSVIWR